VATLQSVLALFDFGLAGTANREIAMARAAEDRDHIANTVRTFELIYWVIALVISLCFAGLSGWIAYSWVTKQSQSPVNIRTAIILGGIAIGARWPVALYTGILQGLERQVLQNGILVVAATTRVGLTIALLLFISSTVYCFLFTQAVMNVMEAALSGYVVYRLANSGGKGRFNLAVIQRVWRFAVGFNLIGTFGMLISGAPQLLISKLLALVELTYYSVAATATGALQLFNVAVQTSLFPRMCSCWQQRDLEMMRSLYLSGLRFTIYVCMPPAMILCFYSSEVLSLWTRSFELTYHVRSLLPLMSIAILANCANAAPLNVVLASGHTRLPLIVNAVSFPFMVAGCYFAIRSFGIYGAAVCWLAFNVISFIIYGQYCFIKILHGRQPFLWGIPLELLFIGGIVGFVSKGFLPLHPKTIILICWLSLIMTSAYVGGFLVLKKDERCMFYTMIKKTLFHSKPVPQIES